MRLKEDFKGYSMYPKRTDYRNNPEVIARVDSIMKSFNNLKAIDFSDDLSDGWVGVKCAIPYSYDEYGRHVNDTYEFWVDVRLDSEGYVEHTDFNNYIFHTEFLNDAINYLFQQRVNNGDYYWEDIDNTVAGYLSSYLI